ncbi:hypothetical protein [Deinococcus sp. LM3]|uniref:hypothetical protein n=1 Tax=Deinococcus sp. LM3 TaxID=1938608 RepID=UPI00118014A1|nr:hypothetical protein [Deinococcus sp. LM3]
MSVKQRRKIFLSAGFVLSKALAEGRAPEYLRENLTIFSQSRYLDALGWNNLNHLPQVVLQLLIERSKSHELFIPSEYRKIAVALFGYREQPFGVTVGLVAAAMLGEKVDGYRERNAPLSILGVLYSVAAVMKALEKKDPFASLDTVNANALLEEYLDGQLDSGTLRSSRIERVNNYQLAVDAQKRLLESKPHITDRLSRWLLPIPQQPIDHAQLANDMQSLRKNQRSVEVNALMKNLTTRLYVIATRAEVFHHFYELSKKARQQYVQGDGSPVVFHQHLHDGSAILKWRVVSAAAVDCDLRGVTTARRFTDGHILTEYLGATDGSGRHLPETFLTTVYHGCYAPARSSRTNLPRGVLRPAGQINKLLRESIAADLREQRPVRVYVDANAFSLGIAYGSLAILIIITIGMRQHELQQIRIDSGFSEDVDDIIEFQIYPKARKRDRKQKTSYAIPPEILTYFFRVFDLHEEIWPRWAVGFPKNGSEFQLESGEYLFYGERAPFSGSDIINLMHWTAVGVPLEFDNKAVEQTAQLMRHGNAQIKKELKFTLNEIQRGFGHRSGKTTRTYTDIETQGNHLETPVLVRTAWEAISAVLPNPEEK